MKKPDMHKSKLIALLKTFSTKELREFKDFVASPFFNKNKELCRFLDFLRTQAPQFPISKIDRNFVFQQLYPGEPFDEKHTSYLMSFLHKLAEQYVGYVHFKHDQFPESYHCLAAYLERNLNKHYHYIFNKIESQLEEYPHRNATFLFYQYLLADISNQHFLKQKIRKHDKRLQVASDNFDRFYFAIKLKYTCEMIDRKKSISADYTLNFPEEINQFIEKNDAGDIPSISIYSTILRALIDEEEPKHFEKLKKLLKKFINFFPQDEMKEMHLYAINYCIRRVNRGEGNFLTELFKLFEQALKSRILLEDNFLSPWAYKNRVGVGLRLNKFAETKAFIENYNEQLAPEFRENAFHYNLAELYYYQQKHGEALEHLNSVEFSDIYYNLDTKKMMLKIYYEIGELEALTSLVAAMKIFLKRNKLISQENRIAYQNFISVLGLLLKNNQNLIPEIEEMISSSRIIADRNWLKEKLNLMI